MPVHIVRELWVSYSNLRKCWQQYRRYQRLMRGLNDRFPDATEQEMAAEGGGTRRQHTRGRTFLCTEVPNL